MTKLLIILVFSCVLLATKGCDPGSTHEMTEIVKAREAREAAERKTEAERHRREQETQKLEAEKSLLWAYVCGIAVIAVVLLFVGTALGSSARTDAKRLETFNDNESSNTN